MSSSRLKRGNQRADQGQWGEEALSRLAAVSVLPLHNQVLPRTQHTHPLTHSHTHSSCHLITAQPFLGLSLQCHPPPQTSLTSPTTKWRPTPPQTSLTHYTQHPTNSTFLPTTLWPNLSPNQPHILTPLPTTLNRPHIPTYYTTLHPTSNEPHILTH